MGLLFGKMSEKQTIMDVNLKTIAAATIPCNSSCYITFCFVNRIDHVVPYQSFYTAVKTVMITMELGGGVESTKIRYLFTRAISRESTCLKSNFSLHLPTDKATQFL